jgi:hypothetical protein
MGLTRIGPVKIETDGHLNPSFRFRSQVDPAGLRDAEISGYFDWAVAEQLSELAANTDAAPTVGGHKGPLVLIWADDAKLQQFVGLYVLESFELAPDQPSSLGDAPVAGTLQACYVDLTVRDYVLTHSAVPKGNDFSLTAKSTVVSPFRPADDAGEEFLTPPGGTFRTRAFDPTYPRDVSVPTPSDSAAIGLYVGTVTDDDDDISSVVYPLFNLGKDEPLWLSQQGGNVRAFDRRAGREVYGPHPFLETTDILVTNGLVEFWVGNRGLAAFLNVRAFDGTTWREVGTVRLSTTALLRGARVVSLTQEACVVALSIQGIGEVRVTLKRGERMLRVEGHGRATTRTVRWYGLPPTVTEDGLTAGTGRFGSGLASGYVEFAWPPQLSNSEWSVAGWWKPTAASSSQAVSGLLSLMDADNAQAGSVYWDSADKKLKFVLDGTTVMSSALSFSAGTAVFFAARFSTTAGMALTVLVTGGTAAHASDGAQLSAGADSYVKFALGYQDGTTWGDGDWGDGVWGGVQVFNGVIDNLMLFSDRLTDDEASTLSAASTALGGLPDPEGRLVWYGSFDPSPTPTAGALTTGLIGDSSADANGITRAVAALDRGVVASGVGLSLGSTEARLAAIVAVAGDAAADQQAQFAAENTQQLRVR